MAGRGAGRRLRDVERPLERTLGQASPVVLATIASVMVLSGVFDFVSFPVPAGRWIVAGDVGTAAFCLWTSANWKRLPSLQRFSDPMFLVVGTSLAVNAIVTMAVSGDVLFTAHLVLLIVCASSVFTSPRWLVALLAVALVAWAPVARRVATERAFSSAAFTLVLATVISSAFHWMRTRMHKKLALLRERDRIRGERLRRALGMARTELEQRREAETEGGRLRDQLLHAQKMEAVARLAGGVAHDMNNVLTSITTVGELLLEDERLDAVARDDLGSILAAAKRGATLSRNLLAFSRRGKQACDVLDVAALIDSARHLLSRMLPMEIELEIDLEDRETAVEGDASQLVQAIVNLCVNAADAMPDGGMVVLSTVRVELQGNEAHRRAVAPGEYLAIQVQDSGAGMDSEARRLAFEPFFSTKPDGTGGGLGLAMVYGTARNHGGNAEVESGVGGGTVVTLHLPRANPARAGDSSAPPSGPRADLTKKTVLLVDDEQSVRAVAKRILERMGLRVRDAENGRRALAVWMADGPFDLVVLDMAMPVMGGKEFFLRLRKLDPTARVLLVSGFAPDGVAQEMLVAGALGFVEKPYTPTGLSRAVRAALVRDAAAPASELGS